MIKKLMMLCVAAMAATGAWATGEKSVVLGDWYEAHSDNEATTCARWDDFWMGASVAIPVTGLASPIPASDVAVTAGTYSEFGRPYVLTEAEMWNRYGAPVLREKNLGNVGNQRIKGSELIDTVLLIQSQDFWYNARMRRTWFIGQDRCYLLISRLAHRAFFLADGPMRPSALRAAVGIRSRVHFSRCYMTPLVEKGLVARTDPDKPMSPKQEYKLA